MINIRAILCAANVRTVFSIVVELLELLRRSFVALFKKIFRFEIIFRREKNSTNFVEAYRAR